MTAFSFYSAQAQISVLEKLAMELKVYNVELDEHHFQTEPQALLQSRYSSGLRYIALRLCDPLPAYTIESLNQAALWCEANCVESVLFTMPGDSPATAEQAIDALSIFRIKVVFENKNDSFLSTPDDMDDFFRSHRNVFLSYNAAEIVSQRIHPFLSALNGRTYRRQLFMIRVQDRCFNGENVLPYKGDAELAECFSSAAAFGLDCWASVEPYSSFGHLEIKGHMCRELCRI